jgi:hypothetical protein
MKLTTVIPAVLNQIRPGATFMSVEPQSEIERIARFELLSSFNMTLAGHNPLARSAHAYSPIVDRQDVPIKGVKWHDRGRTVHFWGFLVHKRIIVPGEYPEENWGALRRIKWEMKERANLNRFRQFIITEGRFDHIGVAGLTLDQRHLLQELN